MVVRADDICPYNYCRGMQSHTVVYRGMQWYTSVYQKCRYRYRNKKEKDIDKEIDIETEVEVVIEKKQQYGKLYFYWQKLPKLANSWLWQSVDIEFFDVL